MDLPEADRQIIEDHSIQNLRRDYRQTFIASTGLRVGDVQEKPEILNLMLKNVTAEGAPDYRSLLNELLELLASSTASQTLRYPDPSNKSVQHRILRYAEEWPKQLDMNNDVLSLCKDVMVKALSPDTDVPDTELWYSVYRLLRTLYFSDLDLLVIEENPLQAFLISYRQQFLTTNYDLFLQTEGWTMELHGSAEALGLLLKEAVQRGQFGNMFSEFLQQLALTEASAELQHPPGTDTTVRERILLFAQEWPNQIAPHSVTLNLGMDALLKALTLDPDKEFWYSIYKLLNSFYFSETELGIIEENPLRGFRCNYRWYFMEKVEPTITRVREKPEIMKSMLKKATVRKSYRELFHAFLSRLALTETSERLRHPIGSETRVRQRIMLIADEWPNQLVLNDKALDLCVNVLLKALAPEGDVSDKQLWYSIYHLLNTLHFSELDLQIIRETPLQKFRSTYRQFFSEKSSFTIDEIQEDPVLLRFMIKDSKRERRNSLPTSSDMRSQMADSDSHDLFHVFLCQLALTDVSGELKHPIASDTTVGRRILLFAEEWPNQLSLSGDALRLCTSVLIKALSPEDEIPDTEFWHSMYHLLNMFPTVESPRANKNIAIMVKDYAVKYAKEHPYLLALNVGLTVVGFAVPPFLGALGFTRAGVGAGSAAAAWQSSLGVVPKGSLFSICQSIGATGAAPMITAAANVSRWALGGFAALQDMLKKREQGRDKEDEPDKD